MLEERIILFLPDYRESMYWSVKASPIETNDIARNVITTIFEFPWTLMNAIINGIAAVAIF